MNEKIHLEPGIVITLCNKIHELHQDVSIVLNIKEVYNGNTKVTYKETNFTRNDNKWINRDENDEKILEDELIKYLTDAEFRRIRTTPNNPESSRSHVIIDLFFKFHKKALEMNYENKVRKPEMTSITDFHIYILDLTGYENRFECDESMKIDMYNNIINHRRKRKTQGKSYTVERYNLEASICERHMGEIFEADDETRESFEYVYQIYKKLKPGIKQDGKIKYGPTKIKIDNYTLNDKYFDENTTEENKNLFNLGVFTIGKAMVHFYFNENKYSTDADEDSNKYKIPYVWLLIHIEKIIKIYDKINELITKNEYVYVDDKKAKIQEAEEISVANTMFGEMANFKNIHKEDTVIHDGKNFKVVNKKAKPKDFNKDNYPHLHAYNYVDFMNHLINILKPYIHYKENIGKIDNIIKELNAEGKKNNEILNNLFNDIDHIKKKPFLCGDYPPIIVDLLPYEKCINFAIDQKNYLSFYKKSEPVYTYSTFIQNIQNYENINFFIINLNNNSDITNKDDKKFPPYININLLKYYYNLLKDAKKENYEGLFGKFYDEYINIYKIIKCLKIFTDNVSSTYEAEENCRYFNFKKILKIESPNILFESSVVENKGKLTFNIDKLIESIENFNKSTFIGIIETVDKIQHIAFDKMPCYTNNLIQKIIEGNMNKLSGISGGTLKYHSI